MNRRAYSIDLLRGIAIIGMVLSGQIAHHAGMPAWLFHAQVPPPEFVFDPSVPGITWVDLVFPFFLFSMGAAFPLSLGRKLKQGVSSAKMVWGVLKRGVLLAFFAIVLGNTGFWLLREVGVGMWLAVLLTLCVWAGFCAMFVRVPAFSDRANDRLNLYGIVALVGMLFLYRMLGVDVRAERSDIIILILSNVVVAGSFLWWLTRRSLLARVAVVAFIVAMKLGSAAAGSWNASLLEWSYASWLFRIEFLEYLCIVIPGSIAGDVIVRWLDTPEVETHSAMGRNVFLAVVLVLLCNMWGLYTRELVANFVFSVILGGAVWWLLRQEKSSGGQMLSRLFVSGFVWLMLGLVFEAAEGGIKKDPATVSYFFVTSGLATCVVLAALVLLDLRARKPGFVIRCGQNPMVAYTAAGYVIVPLLFALSFVIPMPWLAGYAGCVAGVGRGVVITLLMMLVTDMFTRKKFFWRT